MKMANREDRSDNSPIVLSWPMTIKSLFTLKNCVSDLFFLFQLPLNDIPSRFKLILCIFFFHFKQSGICSLQNHQNVTLLIMLTAYCKSVVLANTFYTPILHIIEDIKYYKSHLIHLWCDPYTEAFKVPSFFFKQNVV